MSYDTNRLFTIISSIGDFGMQVWGYDTLDSAATVDTAGYIDDAYERGMQKGDIVIRKTWAALPTENSDLKTAAASAPVLSTWGLHMVGGINPTTGAADLFDALAGTVTNTD